MRGLRWISALVVVGLAPLAACKVIPKKVSDDDSNTQSASSHDAGQDYHAAPSQFPPNGTLIRDYDGLKGKQQLLSAAFPSSSAVQHLADKSGAATASLTLMDGAPAAGSILDALGQSIVQVRGKTGNDVFITVDKAGNYAVVVYVNATVGYFFPSNGDLASCYSVYAPIGNQPLPLLDCVDIGSASSIISDGSRYSNNQLVRSGSRLYYENGQTAYDGSYTYYATGQTLKSGSSSYYWGNGRSMVSSSYLYYPTGDYAYNGYLKYANGNTFANSSASYYSDGDYISSSSSSVYYPNNANLMASSGTYLYYPNGSYLRSSGTLYDEGGTSNVAVVTLSRSFTQANVVVNARASSAWLGVVSTTSDPTFEATLLEQRDLGASLSGNSGVNAPPSPTNLNLVSSTSNSVNVSWNSGGGNTSKYVVRSLRNPSSFTPTCVGGTQTTATTYAFTGLTPSSLYAFLVCASNAEGTLSPAAILLQTAGQPVPTPINVVAGTPGGFTVPVSWESPNNSVTSYVVKASKAPAIPTDCTGGTTIGNVTSYTFSNLEENAKYYLAICSSNASSVYSSPVVVSQRTLPVPPPEPVGFSASSVYPTRITLSWQSGGGTTGSYVLQVAESPLVPAACNVSPIQVSGTVHEVAGLQPAKTYNVRLCAVTINGTLSAGSVYAATTVGIATAGLDFGGAFGSTARGVNNVLNPATSAATCPAGYLPYKYLDTNNIDYPASYCWRRPVGGQDTAYDFGGVIGTINQVLIANPVTGQTACPATYSELLVLGATGFDANLKFCLRPHQLGRPVDVVFGGMWGSVGGVSVFNPATGDQTCAPGFTSTQIYGTTTTNPKDYAVYVCHKSVVAPPGNPSNLVVNASGPASIGLTWSAAAGASTYFVSYQAGGVAPASCSNGVNVGNVTTTSIAGLVPGTQYSFRLCAANSFLNSSSGITISGTTTNAPLPPEIASLTVTSPTSSSALLTWVSGGAGAVGYKVARAIGSTPPVDCSAGTNVGNVLTSTVTGLLQGNTYSFRVCSLNTYGVASTGLTRTVTTSTLVVAINSNGPAVAPFVADTYVVGGLGFATASAINMTGLINPAPMAVYQRNRFGAMTYTIPGLVASQSYRVRLHFCENYFAAINQRKFKVTINGSIVLNNFDIFAVTGARNKATINEFVVPANASGQVVIAFANIVNNADVTGIEVHRVP
jgi:hypothetical protein